MSQEEAIHNEMSYKNHQPPELLYTASKKFKSDAAKLRKCIILTVRSCLLVSEYINTSNRNTSSCSKAPDFIFNTAGLSCGTNDSCKE